MSTEARLERLEKQMQFYKRLVVVLALVIVAGVSMGQTSSDIVDVLKCRKLEVYNSAGEQMVAVDSDKDGGILTIGNSAGKVAASIVASDDGGNLSIRNKEGKVAATISALDDAGTLAIYNKEGKVAAAISVLDDRGQSPDG